MHIVRSGDPVLAEVWPLGGRPHPTRRNSAGDALRAQGKPKVTSFSTGPESEPTHWKQTLFLLREPIVVHEGASGCFGVEVEAWADGMDFRHGHSGHVQV